MKSFIPIYLIFFVSLTAFYHVAKAQTFTTRSLGSGNTEIKIGKKAPEIVLSSPEKKEIKLSDLRGKLVLIQFWASWGKPCRAENKIFNNIYKSYKDTQFKDGKGFTIYSISLDIDSEKWKKAINQDHILWTNHVSELKGANSDISKKYNVKAIPANFLIDGDGNILAKDFRAHELEAILKEHIK